MSDRSAAWTRPLALPVPMPVEPGSYLIERYSYETASGAHGVQWVVHRIDKRGELEHLTACDTRREAAEYVGSHRG